MSDELDNVELLRSMHASLCIRFGTTAPYKIGKVRGEKVGYAQIPSLVLDVYCRDEDLGALVPIVRQYVYGELAERGWSADDLGFVPGTMRGRRRKFRDENESSESYGRDKFGIEYQFRFDMNRELAAATFVGFGSFKSIPEKTS
jgi:hypothetical protein